MYKKIIPKPRVEIPKLLKIIATGIEYEINMTPTGARRNELTTANIQFLEAQERLEKALLELNNKNSDEVYGGSYKEKLINTNPDMGWCPHIIQQYNDTPGFNQCKECGRLIITNKEIPGA